MDVGRFLSNVSGALPGELVRHTSALISPRVARGSYTTRRVCCVYVRFSRSLPKLPARPPGQPRIPYQMQVQTYGTSRAFSATARGY